MKTIILKNTTGSDIALNSIGEFVPASNQIDISDIPAIKLRNASDLLTDIASGDIVVNDGVNDLAPSIAEIFISSEFYIAVSQNGIPPTAPITYVNSLNFLSANVADVGAGAVNISTTPTLVSNNINEPSHGFLQGDAVYLDSADDMWKLAQADNENTLGVGLVLFIDDNNFKVVFSGMIDGFTGMSPGEYYFVSDSTPGGLTAIEPSPPNYSNPIFHATDVTEGFVLPWRPSIDDDAPPSVAIEQGKHTLWEPAGSMIGKITGGADFSTAEIGTAEVIVSTYDFDPTVNESVQFQIGMPKSWNEGTLTFQFHWTQDTAGSGNVIWSIHAMALGDGDDIDGTWGTAITVTDAGGSTDDLFISAETSALTVGNTPTENDMVIFEITRNATDGSDTLAQDAKLVGVKIFYTINAANDA